MDNIHQLYNHNKPFVPPSQGVTRTPRLDQIVSKPKTEKPKVSFEELLSQTVEKQDKLKFSAHAQDRARSRNIEFSEQQLARLGKGVERAAQKGAKEALVMVDQIAAIVSVANKTVITVADTGTFGENVFTNIDGAVIT